jgi:hypothetical protein
MIKRSKSSTSILIAALTLSTIFAASAAALSQTSKTNTPIKGIGVVIKKPPAGAMRTTQTDGKGNFTVVLKPGSYELHLECKRCERLEIGEGGVDLTLTGTGDSDGKRTISKEQLVSGVTFPIEIDGQGKRVLSGHVSLLK